MLCDIETSSSTRSIFWGEKNQISGFYCEKVGKILIGGLEVDNPLEITYLKLLLYLSNSYFFCVSPEIMVQSCQKSVFGS